MKKQLIQNPSCRSEAGPRWPLCAGTGSRRFRRCTWMRWMRRQPISGLDEPDRFNYCALMSKAAKGAEPKDDPKDELQFEEALKKLESIVESMEGGDLPLETLLARFEEGTKLAQVCQTKLAAAELKIQQLEKGASGEMKLKPVSVPNGAADE